MSLPRLKFGATNRTSALSRWAEPFYGGSTLEITLVLIVGLLVLLCLTHSRMPPAVVEDFHKSLRIPQENEFELDGISMLMPLQPRSPACLVL